MARTTTPQKTWVRRDDEHVNWSGIIPFVSVHVVAIAGVLSIGFSWWGVFLCAVLYYTRMFGIAAGYHRYFAHRTFRTSRGGQLFFALLGLSAAQKGPLWWGAHHRNHHRFSDDERDVHSPLQRGFWWAHCGWILCKKYDATETEVIKDFAKYPELRWLNKHYLVPPFVLAIAMYAAFGWVGIHYGFFLSTVLLWHGTFTVNSLMHVWGKRRYSTTDTSRNNWPLSFVTLGENWHNNHHYYQASANQGFFWYEIDIAYYGLRMMSWLGLVWDIRTPPKRVLEGGRTADAAIAIEAEGLAEVDREVASQLAAGQPASLPQAA